MFSACSWGPGEFLPRGLALRGRKAEEIEKQMKLTGWEATRDPPGHRCWCQHTGEPRDPAEPEVGIGVCPLGALQLRGGAPGGRAQPYLSRHSPGGQLGDGGGGSVQNLPGSPFSRPALGVASGWAWGAQDRLDLWAPGPRLSVDPVTSRRPALPGLGRLWAAVCLRACKLINTAVAVVAGDARAGRWRPGG